MQTSVQTDFQGMQASEQVRSSIEQHVAELEQRFGRVTACRVALKGPGGLTAPAALYKVHIRLALSDNRSQCRAHSASGRAPCGSAVCDQRCV